MKYQGKVVLIDKPVYESKIAGLELSADAQAAMEAELMKHYRKLTVFAVGEAVTFCKAGDKVVITPKQLSFCDIVEIDGKVKFVATESNIIGKE